ncbi:MAG: hypothetical protein IPM27_02080 [Nitrosomonadales bacterium]|nr:hypothetical protein [Nitrosomonadales bacterium]
MVASCGYSHTADFSHRLDMVHALEAVMDEAADQGVSFFISGEKGGNKEEENYLCTREHEQLVRNYGSGACFPYRSSSAMSSRLSV